MSCKTEELSIDLLERVLMRLGLSDRPAPTFDGLQTLYAAWCRKVPFDNVRKLIHIHNHDPDPLPGDDATDFFEAWLTYGTGGTCWAGNGALYTLLTSLGFHASRGMGTMLVAPHIPPNHGTVLVAYDETHYIVDASMLHSEPLHLDTDTPTAVTHPAWGVQCSTRDGYWYIRWHPAHMLDGLDCRLDHLRVTRETFRERHEQTRLWSPFNYELYARLICGEAVVSTTGGQRVELNGTGGVVQRLPLDTPTPPPPWSRTARRAP